MKVEIEQVVVTGPLQVELQTYQLETNDLGPNEVLIETEYSYISTGTELANYTGKEPKVFHTRSIVYLSVEFRLRQCRNRQSSRRAG